MAFVGPLELAAVVDAIAFVSSSVLDAVAGPSVVALASVHASGRHTGSS